MKLPQPTERQIQDGIKRVLRDCGCWYVDNSQPRASMVTEGLSDLIVFAKGRIAFVEVKTQTGRLTSAQRSFQAHVENNNGTYLVWRSSVDAAEWINSVPRVRRQA